MADVKWDTVLEPGYLTNPVVRSEVIALPDALGRFPEMLETMFPSTNHSLKTWGRTPGIMADDPHWIGVRRGTPLHTDKRYPRFTHQIMVNVDPGFVLRGLDKVELPLVRGTYFVLDTHSPHQLFAPVKGPEWYLALSVDTVRDDVADDSVQAGLLAYGLQFRFTDAQAAAAKFRGGQVAGSAGRPV